MNILEIIKKKRDGSELSEHEIKFFVSAATEESIRDYQVSAMLMAMFIRGMNGRETADLTRAMAESGDMLDMSQINGTTADKHSTGGVGDKTTFIAAPIAAAMGCKIIKMSGRGLGHTGGTVDKLESIPGFKTEISQASLQTQVNEIGICIFGQSGSFAPADKKLYALRDVTSTVESLPLIAASIMSKKLAMGAECIVLDVKYGSGAFMKTPDDAKKLAVEMMKIGVLAGRRMSSLITNMEVPLGCAIGNALEIIESVRILKGETETEGNLEVLSVELAAEIARLCHNQPPEKSNYWRERAYTALKDGSAYRVFRKMVEYQGGDVSYLDDTSKFGASPIVHLVKAKENGYISSCDAEKIGVISVLLGAGRFTKSDTIDPLAGIMINRSAGGNFVHTGDVIAALHTSKSGVIAEAEKMYDEAIRFSGNPPDAPALIYDKIQ